MQRYPFNMMQQPNWSFAACLQSLEQQKSIFEHSQSETAQELGIGEDGFPSPDKLERFLASLNLNYEHYNPFMSIDGIDGIVNGKDGVIDIAKKSGHIIVAYNKSKLLSGAQKNFFSLLTDYFPGQELVQLHDPSDREPFQVTLAMSGEKSGLMDAMQAREDERYGLYYITERI